MLDEVLILEVLEGMQENLVEIIIREVLESERKEKTLQNDARELECS